MQGNGHIHVYLEWSLRQTLRDKFVDNLYTVHHTREVLYDPVLLRCAEEKGQLDRMAGPEKRAVITDLKPSTSKTFVSPESVLQSLYNIYKEIRSWLRVVYTLVGRPG